MQESVQNPVQETCYGCIYQRYNGPAQALQRGRLDLLGDSVIPLRESDKNLEPGRYLCSKFDVVIGPADQMPEPLEDDCKERR